MTKQYLPSIEALLSSDDERLQAELRLSEVRDHVAHAKDLLDTAEITSIAGAEELASLARLGCRIVEIASALSRSRTSSPRSGERLRAVL